MSETDADSKTSNQESEPGVESASRATLEDRVEYLEAQNAGLKRVGLLALLLLLIVGGLLVYNSYAQLGGIVTRGIVFRDGHVSRYALNMAPNGHLAYVPFDFTGRLPRINFPQAGNLRGMGFYDSKGQLRVAIGTNVDDKPVLALLGPHGKVLWSALPSSVPVQMSSKSAPPSTSKLVKPSPSKSTRPAASKLVKPSASKSAKSAPSKSAKPEAGSKHTK